MKITRQSATTFLCESLSLSCRMCRYRVDLRKGRLLSAGDLCPKCGEAKLDSFAHLVDLASFPFESDTERGFVGQCGCEFGEMHNARLLRKMTSLERAVMAPKDCCHLRAVKRYALNELIWNHVEREKGKAA